MSIGASPPQQPPQLSPDGKWVWDGRQWQPVPEVIGDVAGIIPIKTAIASVPAVAATIPFSPPMIQAPAKIFVPPAADEVAPLWVQPARTGVSLYLYVVAGAVVLVMLMMALNALNIIQLPWPATGSAPESRPAVTPTPQLVVRSDYARADNFLTYSLSPAIVAWNQTVPALNQSCISTLSNSCLDAINATDKELKNVLSVIDHGNIPPCIAVGMDKLRIDLSGMESGLTLGLSGFQQNKKNLLTDGINRFFSLGMAVPVDLKSLDQAQKTQCSTQVVGP